MGPGGGARFGARGDAHAVRRGFVLPTVLFGLLLLAGVVTGAYVAAFQSVRSSREAGAEARTRAAAAGAIAEVLARWDAARFDSLRIGSSDSLTSVSIESHSVLEVRRTSDNGFLLAARVRDSLTHAERGLLSFAILRSLSPAPLAVVRLRSAPADELADRISGSDMPPATWTCLPPGPDIATLTVQSYVSDADYWQLGGGWSWSSLASWASSLPAGGDSLRWRFQSGDLVLSGERFTGVLVVDGNLTLGGGTSIIGIVIVRGAIIVEWLGAAISGRVVADEIRLASGANPSSFQAVHSSCAVRLAGRSRAPAKPLPGVAWADIF